MKKFGNSSKKQLIKPLTLLLLLGCMVLLFQLQARREDRCIPLYSLMQSGLIDEKDSPLAPFFLPFENLYAFFTEQKTSKQQANINDWYNRICQKAKKADIAELIYRSSSSDIKLLLTALKSKSASLRPEMRHNSFARYLRKSGCTETVRYLLYAKNCEPYLIASDVWEEEGKDTASMQELIKIGEQHINECASDYLKLRYLYQLMRLAHYMGNSKQALQLYDELMPFILLPQTMVGNDYSIIYFWIQELRAGALQVVGQRAQAAQLFAFCFLHRPECRASSFASFHISSDEEWQQALALCNDDEERATLYALRAQTPNSRALEEMQAIFKLKKRPDYLEVLLLKEIKELETQILPRFYPYRKKLRPQRFSQQKISPDVMQYLLDLRAFSHQVGQSNIAVHPNLWKIAEAYLFLLAGDYYEGQKLLDDLQNQNLNPQLAQQLKVLSAFATISSFKASKLPAETEERQKALSEIEAKAYELLVSSSVINDNPKKYQSKAVKAYLIDQMAQLYEQLGHQGLKFRCLYPDIFFLQLNPQTSIIEDLRQVIQNLNEIERNQELLTFRFQQALTRDTSGESLDPLLANLQGLLSLQAFNLPRAINYLNEVPAALRDQFGRAAPFKFTFIDSSRFSNPDSSDLYNRYQFAKKMLNLRYEIEANVDNPSKPLYLTGLGLYNTTYFGHAWILRDEYRDPNNWNRLGLDSIYPYPGAPYGNKEVMDVRLPLSFFRKALLSAKLNRDTALAAQAAYMAAKCEQILYFQSKEFPGIPKENVIPAVPDKYRTYFEVLRTEFQETMFYDYLLDECLYFRNYVLRKESGSDIFTED